MGFESVPHTSALTIVQSCDDTHSAEIQRFRDWTDHSRSSTVCIYPKQPNLTFTCRSMQKGKEPKSTITSVKELCHRVKDLFQKTGNKLKALQTPWKPDLFNNPNKQAKRSVRLHIKLKLYNYYDAFKQEMTVFYFLFSCPVLSKPCWFFMLFIKRVSL